MRGPVGTSRWRTALPWTERGHHALMIWDTEDGTTRTYLWMVWDLKPRKHKVGWGRAGTLRQAESAAQETIARRRSPA